MKILVIYATYSTGTLTVSEAAVAYLKEMGMEACLMRADHVQPADIEAHDLVIMGSPSWKVFGKQGMPHEFYYGMMERLKDHQFTKKFAVISLGDEQYALVNGSADHLIEFVNQLGGQLIGEPLKIEGFYYNKQDRLEKLKTWLPTLLG